MEGSVMTATVAAVNKYWLEHAPLVFSHLDERQRRWVGGLLSELLGRGGTKQISELSGLDPKTVRQGRIDLNRQLVDYPDHDRIRRPGGGRPAIKKRSHHRTGSDGVGCS